MAERIRIPRGKSGDKDELFYTKDEIDSILFTRNRLNARVFGNASLFGGSNLFEDFFIGDGSSQGFGAVIGVTNETLSGTYTDFDAELYVGVEQGIDYLIFNANTVDIYVFTPTANAEVGLVNIPIEEQVINAPSGSYIYAQNPQQAAENRRYTERIIDLQGNIDTLNNEDLPDLQNQLDTLDGYIDDPSTIPDNYTFFEGVVSNAIWASTGTFMTAWADQVFANSIMTDRVTANIIDVDDLAADTAFIETLFANEIALTLNNDTGKGGLIRSTAFDGTISSSNVITSNGSKGWAIDYGGNSVFHNTYVRGTIIVEGSDGNAAKQVFATSESIKGLKQELISRKQVIDNGYTTVYNNPNLSGTSKTNLESAKTTLDTEHTDLVNYIDTATSDGEVTSSEYSTFNTHYSDYQSALSTYSQRFQEAVESYTTSYTDTEVLDNSNEFAQQLGWVDFSDMLADAVANDTIISGGFIRTSLIQVDNLMAQNINWTGRLQNTISGIDIYLAGEDVNALRAEHGQLLLGHSGTGSASRPKIEVRANSSNYVELVGRESTDGNTKLISAVSGGEEVFYVDKDGASYGNPNVPVSLEDLTIKGTLTIDTGLITTSGSDYEITDGGIQLKAGESGKLVDTNSKVLQWYSDNFSNVWGSIQAYNSGGTETPTFSIDAFYDLEINAGQVITLGTDVNINGYVSPDTLYMPQYTKTQLQSQNPDAGAIAWNTTAGRGAYYDGTDWRNLNSGSVI